MRKMAILLGALVMGGCATTSSPSWRTSEAVAKPNEKGDLDDLASAVMVAARDPQPSSGSIDQASPDAFESEPAPKRTKRVAARRGGKRHRR